MDYKAFQKEEAKIIKQFEKIGYVKGQSFVDNGSKLIDFTKGELFVTIEIKTE